MYKEGEIGFRGFTKDSKALYFKRHSWFSGMTMLYDALVVKVDKEKQNSILSTGDRSLVLNCATLYAVLDYMLTPNKLSRTDFHRNLTSNGFRKIVSSDFKRKALMSPDGAQLSINLYEAYYVCHEKADQELNLELGYFDFR